MRRQISLFIIFIIALAMTACDSIKTEYSAVKVESEDRNRSVFEETLEVAADSGATVTNQSESINREEVPLSKDDVMGMRAVVLEGMSESEIETLCAVIKNTHKMIEMYAIYDNFFARLSDPDDLTWNYFDENGEIQIGWAYEGSSYQSKNRWKKKVFLKMNSMKSTVLK